MLKCDFCSISFEDFRDGGCICSGKTYCPDCQEKTFGYRGLVIQVDNDVWVAKNLEEGMRILGKFLNKKGGDSDV